MPRIVLLPNWELLPNWQEVFGRVFDYDPDKKNLKDLKEEWEPDFKDAKEVEDVEAFAFPTPLAWAEMMAALLRRGLFNHLLCRHYKQLLLGLVLGQLELEIIDLKDLDFGKVLAQSDNRYRYFGLLRGSPDSKELQGKVFGGTSPDTLFWPSPRRSKAEWKDLDNANITKNLEEGYTILADLRDLLKRERLWDPDRVPWMNGLNNIAGEHGPSPANRLYHVHSRHVGPVLARYSTDTHLPFYLPVYENDFAARYLRALTGNFKAEDNAISVLDDKFRKHYEISLPAVPADGDRILAGAGIIRVSKMQGAVSQFESKRLRLNDDENGEGLFSLTQPLYEEFNQKKPLYDALSVDGRAVKERPYAYPDIIRLAVARLGEAGLRNTSITFSDRAYEHTLKPESPGLPLVSDLRGNSSDTHWHDLEFDQDGLSKRAIYIERYSGYTIGDLAALGWILCSFFVGEASYVNGKIRDNELTPLLREHGFGRPLDPANEIYDKVQTEALKFRRLAMLQRFMKAYSEKAASQSASESDRLCQKAADAFVRRIWVDQWALPDQPVLESGRSPRNWEEIRVGKLIVSLAKD